MTSPTVSGMEHIGTTAAVRNHDHDLVAELARRLEFLWRCDQYIANAEGHPDLQDFWRQLKEQDSENVSRLRGLIKAEIERDCF